jgi:hypothetical protein
VIIVPVAAACSLHGLHVVVVIIVPACRLVRDRASLVRDRASLLQADRLARTHDHDVIVPA